MIGPGFAVGVFARDAGAIFVALAVVAVLGFLAGWYLA